MFSNLNRLCASAPLGRYVKSFIKPFSRGRYAMSELPAPEKLKQQIPITSAVKDFVEESRQAARDILRKVDSRRLLIVGPCSIHDVSLAKDYASFLRELAPSVSSRLFILMRLYFEKPRTHTGWKGFINDPFLNAEHDIETGLRLTRRLLVDLAEAGIPAATEFLDPLTAPYFSDLISWGCIGARTVSSQIHRQLASSLPMPIGMKNSPDGSIDTAVNGLIACSHKHTFIGLNEQGRASIMHSNGNPDAHLVLRGGETKPNYDPISVADALNRLERAKISRALLIDCSHDNSGKDHTRQPAVFRSVIEQMIDRDSPVRGLLLESHLNSGSQAMPIPPAKPKYGVSLTDACLDRYSTQRLILSAYDTLTNATRDYETKEKELHECPATL